MFHADPTCVVYLYGYISQLPSIEQNYFDDIVICVKQHSLLSENIQNHRVIVHNQDAHKILKNGRLGMPVIIYGALRVRERTEIVARYVEFDNLSGDSLQQYFGDTTECFKNSNAGTASKNQTRSKNQLH